MQNLAVLEALTTASARNEKVRTLFTSWLEQFIGTVSTVFQECYPHQDRDRCWAAAYGVASIYFSHEGMMPLQLPKKYEKAAMQSALALLARLQED